MTRADRDLFDRALFRQENNRIPAAIKVWKQFLQRHPRSFEAHNNLGLVYFEDDQIDPSITAFETALSLEPNDEKIKKNLVRVLKFKATLLNEASDYNGAVDTLKRAQEVSSPREKEKIGFIIEKFEGKVFEQAKQANTMEAYESFLKRFPTSTKNADEARMKIEGLKPRDPMMAETAMNDVPEEELAPIPAMDKTEDPGIDPLPETRKAEAALEMEREDSPQTSSTVEDSGWESADKGRMVEDGPMAKDDAAEQTTALDAMADETPAVANPGGGIVPEQPKEALRTPARPVEIATQPEPKPSTGADLFPTPDPEIASSVMENSPKEEQALKRIVEIVTRRDPLRVREEPSLYSRVLATMAKGSTASVVTEQNGWYQVEFSDGQTGWISKKYARLME
ncbi:MAG: hypothetical protein NPINA01_16880 [Nitrospinaceae bacterium]|nr:MAG: hypothetical protein NPINA01_16880 [Nitrospinaceae bacterium]